MLWGGRLQADETVQLPVAPHTHVFVAVGNGSLEGIGELGTGDAARLTDAGTLMFTAGPEGAELSVWATA